MFTCMILTCRQLDSDIGAVTSACSSPGEMESIATPPNECNNEAGISTEGFGKVITELCSASISSVYHAYTGHRISRQQQHP